VLPESALIVEGKTVEVTNLLVCTNRWLLRNYAEPLRAEAWRITADPNSISPSGLSAPPAYASPAPRRRRQSRKVKNGYKSAVALTVFKALVAIGIIIADYIATNTYYNDVVLFGTLTPNSLALGFAGLTIFVEVLNFIALLCKWKLFIRRAIPFFRVACIVIGAFAIALYQHIIQDPYYCAGFSDENCWFRTGIEFVMWLAVILVLVGAMQIFIWLTTIFCKSQKASVWV